MYELGFKKVNDDQSLDPEVINLRFPNSAELRKTLLVDQTKLKPNTKYQITSVFAKNNHDNLTRLPFKLSPGVKYPQFITKPSSLQLILDD